MTVFHVEVTEHAGQFGGGDPSSEHGCVARCLDLVRQAVGSHSEVGDEASPTPLRLNDVIVGRYWWGADSHTVVESKARQAAQAAATASAPKAGKAA
jgi:hypothetical protein